MRWTLSHKFCKAFLSHRVDNSTEDMVVLTLNWLNSFYMSSLRHLPGYFNLLISRLVKSNLSSNSFSATVGNFVNVFFVNVFL